MIVVTIADGAMKELMLLMGEDLQIYLFFGFLAGFLLVERFIPKRRPAASQSSTSCRTCRLPCFHTQTSASHPFSTAIFAM